VRDVDEIIENVGPYLGFVPYIVVSMGARGAVAVSKDERYQAVPPKVNVKSSIGAGDALVGGLAYGLSEGLSLRDALTLGVACGTASTLNAAGVYCSREDVEKIRQEVLIKNI
jgi:fructose-1-phosphate kinase PfkB-like protein